MIREAALALSITVGSDVGTAEYAQRQTWCRPDAPDQCAKLVERNPHLVWSAAAYTAAGVLTTEWVERKWGHKAGWITLGVWLALPIAGTVDNVVKIKGTKRR